MPAPPHAANSLNWLALLILNVGLSSYGLLTQLHSSKEGQGVLDAALSLLDRSFSGDDVDLLEAKNVGGQLVRVASSSNVGLFCAANLAAVVYVAVGLATKALFLGGGLTATEHSKLEDRLLRFAVLKVLFLGSGVYGDLTQWLGWVAAMAYFSMFVKLAALRGDALLSSPSATLAQHLRIVLLLGGILAQDISWIAGYVRTLGDGSWSHALLWLYDAVFVAVDASLSLVKYATHAVDHARRAAAEARGEEWEPWGGRSALVDWVGLVADVVLPTLTLFHCLHIWWLHGLQAQLIDGALFLEVKWLAAALHQRLRGHTRYRRLLRQLHTAFPDASPAQLSDSDCPICLESMKAAKRLPCSHVAHASCLAAWLQQSSRGLGVATCPLCRADLDIAQPLQQRPPHEAGAQAGAVGSSIDAAGLAADAGSDAAPARRVTRLQTRLATAQLAAVPGAGKASR